MSEKTVTIKVDDKEVVYDLRNETWTYDNIDMDAVKKLDSNLFNRINATLVKEVEAVRKAKEKAEAEAKKKRYATAEKARKKFVGEVETLLPKGFSVKSNPITETYYNPEKAIREFSVVKDDFNTTFSDTPRICFDDTVWRQNAWRSSKTNKPWKLELGYSKTIRYGSLEKVLAKAVTFLSEQHEISIKREKNAKISENFNTALKEHIESVEGVEFNNNNATVTHISEVVKDAYYHNHMGVSVTASINTVDDEITMIRNKAYGYTFPENHEPKKTTFKNVQVSGIFTAEQLKQLADFVNEMGVETVAVKSERKEE